MLTAEFPRLVGKAEEGDVLAGLLARVATGDQAAFRQLYERSAGRLFAVALRIAGDRTLAEAALQEAYACIWREAGRFDSAHGNALTWLIAITRHRAIDLRRNRSGAARDSAVPARENLPGLGQSALARCLAALDTMTRDAILLAYRDGLSYEELSVVLGVPLDIVKARIGGALTQIKLSLDNGS